MSTALLTFTAVVGLVTGPVCGNLLPPCSASAKVCMADQIAGHAMVESGGDPLAIGVNPDRGRGLPPESLHPNTKAEAVATAKALLASGRTIGFGLMQIDSAQLARHNLSIEDAFETCRSLAAGVEHYSGDVEAATIYALASRRYNSGAFDRSGAYAQRVQAAVQRGRIEAARFRVAQADVPTAPAPAVTPPVPVDPTEPPAWDLWVHADWQRRKAGQVSAPPPAAPSPEPSAVTITEATGEEP